MIDDTPAPVVSAPAGSLDDSACAALEKSIVEHAGRNDMNHIIDLRAVDKVDARTIRIMIKINRRISEIGGSVRLVIANSKALRYIKLTALERVFRVYPTPAAALAGYASDDHYMAQSAPKGDDSHGQ